ncbi:MAG: DUF6883 domain-containing protein [Pseudomonadota bacterium]
MRLPNGDRATVPLDRLRSYVLSTDHPKGKHKARVFAAALGLSASEALVLQAWLLDLAINGDAEPSQSDQYGQRFVIRGKMRYNGREAEVRTVWIVRTSRETPEFLTALVE